MPGRRHDTMKWILDELGLRDKNSGVSGTDWVERPGGHELVSLNPATGKPIASVITAGGGDYERVVSDAARAFEEWRTWPAPKRGEVIRLLGDALRAKKKALGALV